MIDSFLDLSGNAHTIEPDILIPVDYANAWMGPEPSSKSGMPSFSVPALCEFGLVSVAAKCGSPVVADSRFLILCC